MVLERKVKLLSLAAGRNEVEQKIAGCIALHCSRQ
jgi:hypothetical protein